METTELKVGQVLMGADFMDWEVIDGNVPEMVAWEWMRMVDPEQCVAPLVPARESGASLHRILREGSLGVAVRAGWTNYAGVVVLVPKRDVKIALAIRRVDDKFQLLGRRGG